jgi:hypothetical protein
MRQTATVTSVTAREYRKASKIEKGRILSTVVKTDHAQPRVCGVASANLGKESLAHHRWTASSNISVPGMTIASEFRQRLRRHYRHHQVAERGEFGRTGHIQFG